MKKLCFLFLFFAFSVSPYPESTLCFIHAQESVDSLRYYHNRIIKPESGEDFSSAFLFFEKEIQRQLMQGDTLPAIQNLRRVGIGQFELGFFYESEATVIKALKLLDDQKRNTITREARSGLLNHLGIVYRKLRAYDKAISYYRTALELAVDFSDSIPAINNISNVYLDRKNYDLALKNSLLALNMWLKQDDSLGIARAYDNLGFVQSKLKIPEAYANMEKAINIRRRHRDLRGLYSSNHHLSTYFLGQGNRQRALDYAEQAFNMAQELKSASYLEDALSLILDLSNDPKIIAYRQLTDSISSAKQLQENKYAVIKYNVEKEQQNTRMAQLQNEKEKRYKILFLSAFVLAVLGATVALYRKHQKRKKELVQTVHETEARISKKIHDNLANDVSGVMTFVEHQLDTASNTKEKLLSFLNNIYLRARDISMANAGVDVHDFSTALKGLVALNHPTEGKVITSPFTNINWNAVRDYKKIQLYKCLQELLVNSKKHSNATLISIAFNRKGRKNEIIYSDNGIGFNPDTIIMGGMKNVETRMTEIGGSFSFESNKGKGFKASLLF